MSAPRFPDRVLVIGESLVDLVVSGAGTDAVPGGSPLNVAVGLARLRVPTVLATEFGDDANGRLIAEHLARAGVEVLREGADRPTATATARIADDGTASYSFAVDWRLELPSAPASTALHVGSIAAFRAPGADAVLAAVERSPAHLISFDPNIRPALLGDVDDAVGRLEHYARHASVVKLSDVDAAWLFPSMPDDEVVAWLLERGVGLVVLTLGDRGSLLVSPSARVEVAAMPTVVVDTIGAGDAYMSGLLGALLELDGAGDATAGTASAELLAEVGRIASTSAALAVARPGADPPERPALDAALRAAVR